MVFQGKQIDLDPSDLHIEDLNNQNVREVIARAPGHYAYYSAKAADVAAVIRLLEHRRDTHMRVLYNTIPPQKTETARKNAVLSEGHDLFGKIEQRLIALESLRKKLSALANAFDLQIKALQTVGGLIRTEMKALLEAETNPLED